MRDQIVFSKTNGFCAVAIPLYRWHHEEPLAKLEGYTISMTKEKPIAYIIDCGEFRQLLNASFVESNLEFVGDL